MVVYNRAIYGTDDETVSLYIPSKNSIKKIDVDGKIIGEVADNGISYSDYHFSLIPMNDWGKTEDMIEIKAKTITFDKICDIHNITEIDLLQIDTEGFDAEIIRMIDLSKVNIKKIIFEIWNFPPENYKDRYSKNELDNKGRSGLENSKRKLQQNGYILEELAADIVATKKII